MKTTLIFSIIVLLFLALSGCGDKEKNILDLCKNTVCQNGGTCESGKCNCPPYYSGANCEVDNRPVCMKEHEGSVNLVNQTGHDLRFFFDDHSAGQIASGQSTGAFDYPVGTYTYYSQYWYGAFGVGQWVNNDPGTLTVVECEERIGGYQ